MCLGGLSAKAFSQEKTPGIIESLERLLEVHKKQYLQNQTNAQVSQKSADEILSYKDLKIDPQLMKSILFHSDEKFLKLVGNDECRLLSTLENNLLKSASGDIESIAVLYKNKENKTQSVSLQKKDFFANVYKEKCLNNKEFSILFNENNFEKTVSGIKFTVPKTTNDCNIIHQEWLENSYTPYLCNINQIIKKSKDKTVAAKYIEKISPLQRSYIENLCNNLNSPELFCEKYLTNDVWTKVLNGEAPIYKMSYKCKNIFNLSEVSNNNLKQCAAKLLSDKSICETKGNNHFPSNYPFFDCDTLSNTLLSSKLNTDYHDCPAIVDNEAITNAHRILYHFNPRKIVTTKDSCSGEANYSFARLYFEIKYDEAWPLKICYLNNVTRNEDCIPYVPGSREDEPISEDKVVAKILYLQKGAPQKTTCKIVDTKSYNPLRTEYKFGCFILYEADTCTAVNCNKKVIWEEKVQKDIKFTGKPIFDYFSTSYINERYSFASLINEVRRIQSRPIKNLTHLKFYLDQIPLGIIHGVGCAEDLLPEEFQRTIINQCRPLPFIIDGYTKKANEIWLNTRTGIDDLHSPRLILWQNIFNSISAYGELHPLNAWTLYGLKN